MYLPYVYTLIHKITGEIYHGYRSENVKLNLRSWEDLGVKYFTSSGYINKDNFHEYDAHVVGEFFTSDWAYDHEQQLIKQDWDNPLLLNKWYSEAGKQRFKPTPAGIQKLRDKNTGKKWFNNGIIEVHSREQPDGFMLGRLINPFPDIKGQPSYVKGYKWFTNGTEYTMALVCPLGWWPGKEPASDKTNQQISETMKNGAAAAKGKKWFTDGIKSVLTFECPLGWQPGHRNQVITYTIINITTKETLTLITPNLKEFCKLNKLRYGSILNTVHTQKAYKGWVACRC